MSKIVCPRCNSSALVKDGNHNGEQGYKCKNCKKRFSSGKYEPTKKKLPTNNNFYLKDYADKLKCNSIEERKIATSTAKKIAKQKREYIEQELLKNLFKGNQEVDYGIIKILLYTKGWGIELLLNLVFNNDINLSRLHISTISKYLAINSRYSWNYIKTWLYNDKIPINDVSYITPESFITTTTKYENYDAIITRFFYKVSKFPNKKLKLIFNKSEIAELLNKDFLKKFNRIKFDDYYGSYGLEITNSIRIIFEKLNNNIDNYIYSNDFIKLGRKWENFVDKVINKMYSNVAVHKRLKNNLIPDISIIDKNGKCDKIIECKLNINYNNLYETIIKYSNYCNTIEMWGLSKSNFKYDYINMKVIFDAIKKYYYNDIEKEINKNLKLKILCFSEISNHIQGLQEIEELNLLHNEYYNLGGSDCYLDIENPLDINIDNNSKVFSYSDNEKEEVKIKYESFLNDINSSLNIDKNIYINTAIKNKLKYKIKSGDFINSLVINGIIQLYNLRKFKIPIQYYKDEEKEKYKNVSFLELSLSYTNNCEYTVYEVIFNKIYLIDNEKNKYDSIRGHYMTFLLNNNCHIKDFDIFSLPQAFKTNREEHTKLFFKIPDDFKLQELKLKIHNSKNEDVKLIKFVEERNNKKKTNIESKTISYHNIKNTDLYTKIYKKTIKNLNTNISISLIVIFIILILIYIIVKI